MPCDCAPSETCPRCDCSITLKRQKRKIDSECVFAVADQVQIAFLGSKKMYLIRLILKNCTNQILNNLCISLDLKCAFIDLPTVPPCEEDPKSGNCLGIMTLSPSNSPCLLQDLCIQASPYRVNENYNGFDDISLLDHSKPCNIRVPPGETSFTVRFFGSSSSSLISPMVTVSLVYNCQQIRKVVQLKSECIPQILDKSCTYFVDCPT